MPAVLKELGRVEPVGQAFPVFKLGAVDVALPRRESKIGRGHKAFAVEGDPFMSVEDAARRRDFTINAVAWDPLTGEYVDPFNGRADLDARVLRVVDADRFADDSLRVLRALQFAARFGLTLEPASFAICRAIALDDLPAERVWGEFEKLLLVAERPSIGFALGRELGVIEQLLPEMVPLYTCPQDPEWHPEGDVWTHTLHGDRRGAAPQRRSRARRSSRSSCLARCATTSASRRRRFMWMAVSSRRGTRRPAWSRPRASWIG